MLIIPYLLTQSVVKDALDIVTIEKISVIGFLLLVIFALGYVVRNLQKNIDKLRTSHEITIQALNDKHTEEITKLNEKLIDEIRKNGEAYQQSALALQMILKNQRGE